MFTKFNILYPKFNISLMDNTCKYQKYSVTEMNLNINNYYKLKLLVSARILKTFESLKNNIMSISMTQLDHFPSSYNWKLSSFVHIR